MNIIKKVASSVFFALTLGVAGTASAAIIDTVTQNPDVLITTPNTSFPYFHNIVDNGFVVNFDTVTSATIEVRLTDDNAGENYRISLGDQVINGMTVANNTVNQDTGGTFVSITLSALSLADLNADGQIGITVSSTNNSFYFAGSTLTAQVTPGQTPAAEVPEPASVALLGLGLLGVVASRRKSTKNKNA